MNVSLHQLLAAALERPRIGVDAHGILIITPDGDRHDLLTILDGVTQDRTATVTDRAWRYLRSTQDTLKLLYAKRPDLRDAPAVRTQHARLHAVVRDLRTRLVDRIALESMWSDAQAETADLALVGLARDVAFAYSGDRIDVGFQLPVHVFQTHATLEAALRENAGGATYLVTHMPDAAWRTLEDALAILYDKCVALRASARASGAYPYCPRTRYTN